MSIASDGFEEPKKKKFDRKAFATGENRVSADENNRKQTQFPLKKPGSKNFFRVCTDPDSRAYGVNVLEGTMGKLSVVTQDVVDQNADVAARVKSRNLYVCVNHNGDYFVWPVGNDGYLEIAKMAAAAPWDAKMQSHANVRKLWKPACLATQYGAEPERIAKTTNCGLSTARGIHYTHHHLFRRYWDYIDTLRVEAQASGFMQTRGGWKIQTRHQKEGTLGNFPVQAHGAEIMRLAVSYMVGEGLNLCTTVHDAVLIEGFIEGIGRAVEVAKACWCRASMEVIDYQLSADDKIVRYPDRYEDKDGKAMFTLLMSLLEETEQQSCS